SAVGGRPVRRRMWRPATVERSPRSRSPSGRTRTCAPPPPSFRGRIRSASRMAACSPGDASSGRRASRQRSSAPWGRQYTRALVAPLPRVLIGTTNPAKVREHLSLLGDLPIDWVTPDQIGRPPDIDETGQTFLENALLKARAYAAWSGLPALAD